MRPSTGQSLPPHDVTPPSRPSSRVCASNWKYWSRLSPPKSTCVSTRCGVAPAAIHVLRATASAACTYDGSAPMRSWPRQPSCTVSHRPMVSLRSKPEPAPTAVPRDITTPNGVLFQNVRPPARYGSRVCRYSSNGWSPMLHIRPRPPSTKWPTTSSCRPSSAYHVPRLMRLFGPGSTSLLRISRKRRMTSGRASRRDRSPSGRPTSPPIASPPGCTAGDEEHGVVLDVELPIVTVLHRREAGQGLRVLDVEGLRVVVVAVDQQDVAAVVDLVEHVDDDVVAGR